ncbi:DUF1510 family protein [Gracilibacillus oryzae]|uniref:DUF1510 family protein n=1 Tax=Gracilibacillus oryzae TaxID=1672701 RepID=A0A7C8GR63_9BACI|nr:YrrS family protein [Gracilibacillus oryzae]KAB8127297.1 DUF1510 family protein [Gracilibacillus oryzae]
MADQYGNITRSNRFSKKRKSTKTLTILYISGFILLVVLIAVLLLGGNDEEAAGTNDQQTENEGSEGNNPNSPENQVILEDDENDESDANSDSTTEEPLVVEVPDEEDENQSSDHDEESNQNGEQNEQNEQANNNNNAETYDVEPAGENVKKAYEGNWQPVGTEQEGPHVTEYDDGSVDRKEMSRAVEVATGIPAGQQITWWAGRAGEDAVEVTVSPDSDESQVYRVHLVWVEEQGWQPTLVEELIENKRN